MKFGDIAREVLTFVDRRIERKQRHFIVTRMDGETLTVDGNNPLCGREVVFRLEILTVRDATDQEMKAGGAIGAAPNVDPSLMRRI